MSATAHQRRRRLLAQREAQRNGQVETTGGQTGGNEGGNENPAALTQAQYNKMMQNKGNVTAALKGYGVEFEETAKADDLRALLKEALAAKGLLPDGN